jgi:hypothetical protein
MDIEYERKTATLQVDVFRTRYRKFGEEYFPLQIALRWQQAVHSDPIDPNLLNEIFNSAKDRRKEFDIAFFTFCNHMERIIRDYWRESFK